MDHYMNFLQPHAKEPSGFDHFKAFVHHGGGINSDALSHLPIWMRQSLFWCDLRKFCQRQLSKRAARSSQHEATDFLRFPSPQALMNGIVLTIHGEQGDPGAFYR